jgi:hypothetical protein
VNRIQTRIAEMSRYWTMEKIKVKQSNYRTWTGPEGSRMLRLPDFMTVGT